jgi:hypothetical protein
MDYTFQIYILNAFNPSFVFAHHYETSIRVSRVQQYVENILIIIYI